MTPVVEQFISRMYSNTSDTMDDARVQLFLHKGVGLQKLPMTSHTFVNKLRRAMYQASSWTQSLKKTPTLPGYFLF